MKFHVRAPIRAANTSAGPRYPAVTVCPTVLATAVPTKKNATKFHPAAHSTAQRGRRTRVATGSEAEALLVEAEALAAEAMRLE